MSENNQDFQLDHHEELTRVVPQEVLKMPILKRIINIFAAPGEVMENIKTYSEILAPYLIAIVIGLATIPISMQVTDMSMQEMSMISIERWGIDLFGGTAETDFYGDDLMGNAMNAFAIVGIVVMVFLTPMIWGVIATLGLWILSKIFRGRATFGQIFSMNMHVYIISALGMLVVSTLMVMTGRLLDMTTLAAVLMPNGRMDDVTFNTLTGIGIFPIWTSVVTFIGLKVINEISVARAAIITVISFLIGLAVSVVMLMSSWWIMDMSMGMVF